MKKFTILLLLALTQVWAGHAMAASLEDFVRPRALVDIQISPDGAHLAMLRREDKDTLYVVRRADNSVVTGVSSSPGQRFHSFRWANTNRILIEPAVELESHARPLPTGALLGFSIDGRQNGYLRRSHTDEGNAQMFRVVSDLPGDADHVIVARHAFIPAPEAPETYVRQHNDIGLAESILPLGRTSAGFAAMTCVDACIPDTEEKPTLERLNVYTGKSTPLVEAPGARGQFLVNADATRILFTGIRSGLVSIYHSQSAPEWQEVKYFTQYYELGATPVGFSEDGSIMALDNLVDTLGLSRLGLKGEVDSVFRDKVADIDSLVSARGGKLIAASFSAGFPSWYYHDADSAFARTHKALRAAYPESDIDVTSFTDQEQEAVVRVYSDRNPGTYLVVNLETGKAEDLLRQMDWLNDDELVTSQPVQIPTRDGFEIYGYLTKPRDKGDAPPLIVMTQPHPFTARFEWGYDARAQLFANAGYAVMQINTRGAPGYGQRYTTGSSVELDNWTDHDIVDAVSWASRLELIDPDKVCLFGSGNGAYSAVLTAMRNPDAFRCVIAADGEYRPEDLPRIVNPARLFPVALLGNRDPAQLPWFDNLIDNADRLRTPTLIVSEKEFATAAELVKNSNGKIAQHVVGVTNLNRVTQTQKLVSTYQRILEFIENSLAVELAVETVNLALHQLVTPEQRKDLQRILDKVYADIQRAIRVRDSRDLPAGLQRRATDPGERIRKATRALSGRDKEVQRVLPESYLPAYERFKANYAREVERAINRNDQMKRYILSGGDH